MISVIGISHKTSGIEEREKFMRSAPTPQELIARGASEAFVLSTCNRHEIYSDDAAAGASETAVRHLFRVASSLESLVVGETQILGQIREAEETSARAGTLGPILRRMIVEARRVGARVRTETGLGAGAASVASVAVRLAEKIGGELRGQKILIIGRGEMGRIFAKSFRALGADVTLAGGRDFTLAGADVVVTASDAATPIITPDLLATRTGRPIFMIDVGVPRNIDPSVGSLADCYLYNIDDLESIAGEHRKKRHAEIAAATRIVEDSVAHWNLVEEELRFKPALARGYENLKALEAEMFPGVTGLRLRRRRFFHFARRVLMDGDAAVRARRRAAFTRLCG